MYTYVHLYIYSVDDRGGVSIMSNFYILVCVCIIYIYIYMEWQRLGGAIQSQVIYTHMCVRVCIYIYVYVVAAIMRLDAIQGHT